MNDFQTRQVIFAYDEMPPDRTMNYEARKLAIDFVAKVMRIPRERNQFTFFNQKQMDTFHERVGEALKLTRAWT